MTTLNFLTYPFPRFPSVQPKCLLVMQQFRCEFGGPVRGVFCFVFAQPKRFVLDSIDPFGVTLHITITMMTAPTLSDIIFRHSRIQILKSFFGPGYMDNWHCSTTRRALAVRCCACNIISFPNNIKVRAY